MAVVCVKNKCFKFKQQLYHFLLFLKEWIYWRQCKHPGLIVAPLMCSWRGGISCRAEAGIVEFRGFRSRVFDSLIEPGWVYQNTDADRELWFRHGSDRAWRQHGELGHTGTI